MNPADIALEPCPFCGEKAEWKDDTGEFDTPFGLVTHHAENCFLSYRMEVDWVATITAWNTRAALSTQAPMPDVHGVARALAERHGLRKDAPLSSLEPWIRDAETALSAIFGPSQVNGALREVLAAGYISLSGKAVHASDCATSNAPALMPGPCDCNFEQAPMPAASAEPVAWPSIETCPMWTVAIVTDGEHVAKAQKAESDFGGHYWAIEPEDALEWEPTLWTYEPTTISATVGGGV